MKNKKFKNDIVFSTEDDVVEQLSPFASLQSIENSDQVLYVEIDRKSRKGKSVTLITNFKGSDSDLKELGKVLKSKCGVGGSTKNNEIMIQGDFRDKIMLELENLGYTTKRKGG